MLVKVRDLKVGDEVIFQADSAELITAIKDSPDGYFKVVTWADGSGSVMTPGRLVTIKEGE